MPKSRPAISSEESRQRLRRIQQIAKRLGFVGTVEYRHEPTTSGGAQFRKGIDTLHDQLIVFAESFDRDADPNDFSLEAMIAHERGHQILFRHPMLARQEYELETEEVVASVIGAIISESADDRRDLYNKAVFDVVANGMSEKRASEFVRTLRVILRRLL